jgi:hypothetical protein
MLTDTSPEAEKIQTRLFAEAGPVRRAALALSHSRMVIGLARRGLLRARPARSSAAFRRTIVWAHYDNLLAEQVGRDERERELEPPDLTKAIAPAAAALRQLGVAYAVGGSVASSTHGVPRSTVEADLVAALRPEHAAPLAALLADKFYLDEQSIREAIARGGAFNLIHQPTMLKVDVFILGARAYDRVAFGRRREEALEDQTGAPRFPMVSPEDMVLAKLEWYRAGGEVSERPWTDLQGVLKVQGDRLDLPYLRRWAAEIHVDDLLERAIIECAHYLRPTEAIEGGDDDANG